MAVRSVIADIRRNLGAIKEKVMEKLGAASVPAEALENARQFLETIVRDVTVAAQGLTKDALLRIKTHLVDILPSLSPQHTRKMVDDAEKEARGAAEGEEYEEDDKKEEAQRGKKGLNMSPALSSIGTFSRL